MTNIIRAGVIILIVGGLLIGCEDDETSPVIDHPLTGVYSLTEMTINVEATTLSDTTLFFIAPQNGVNSVMIPVGTQILVESELYTDADTEPIGGIVTLNSDLSANLAGSLPINWGTGCVPSVVVTSGLDYDGVWSADTSSGVFTLDLVLDPLDIDGSYSLTGNQLEVTYIATLDNDERTISTVNYMGADVAVVSACLPVSTVTERILTLSMN